MMRRFSKLLLLPASTKGDVVGVPPVCGGGGSGGGGDRFCDYVPPVTFSFSFSFSFSFV